MGIRQAIEYFKKFLKLIKKMSKENDINIIYLFFDYLWAYLRHGCLLKQYDIGQFYRKKEFERRQMLTYRRIFKIIDKYNDPRYIHLLNNKVDFNRHFSQFVHRKWAYSLEMSYDDFLSVVHSSPAVIIKPIDDWEGHGIRKIFAAKLSEQELTELFNQLKTENVLIEECIQQDKRMTFANESVNTIRIYSFFNPDNSQFIILKPLLRVGVGDAVIDNYCSGGCVYELDLKDGIIVSRSLSKVNPNVLRHPGTNIIMLGYPIPHWSEVISTCEQAHRHIPQCGLVGWDIAITENGEIEFIEGNHNPDYELLEFIGETGHYQKIKKCLKN